MTQYQKQAVGYYTNLITRNMERRATALRDLKAEKAKPFKQRNITAVKAAARNVFHAERDVAYAQHHLGQFV